MPICSECEMEAQYQSWLPSLPPERQKKSLRYRFIKDGWLCAAAYMLLMHALHEEGIPVSQDWRICTTDLGKPYFLNHPHVHFNLAHCDAGVACIIADVPVGIDIESIRPLDRKIIARVFTEQERTFLEHCNNRNLAFTEIWTLKESWLKATGYGLNYPPKDVTVNASEDGVYYISVNGYNASVLLARKAYCVSACWLGRKPFATTIREVAHQDLHYPVLDLQH